MSIFIFSQYIFNRFCQYFSFLNIFLNMFCPSEKCGVTPHCLYNDSLTLKGMLKELQKYNQKLFLCPPQKYAKAQPAF